MLHKSRQTAVPVLDFHGTIVVGFDKPKVRPAHRQVSLRLSHERPRSSGIHKV